MNVELKERSLTTADLAAASEAPAAQPEAGRDFAATAIASNPSDVKESEALAPLFPPDVARDFRARWSAVQSGFVDDPRHAVGQGDELVAQVMKSLAETFSSERKKLEGQVNLTDKASTEDLRVALRRYRSFFERLLSV